MRRGDYRYADCAPALAEFFRRVGIEDKLAERRARRGIVTAILGGVTAFGSLFLSAGLHPIFLVLVLLGGAALVGGIVYWYVSSRQDLDDRKVLSAQRLVNVLRADVPAGQKIFVHVDFRNYQQGVKRYQHGWLELRTALADGNGVALTIRDTIRRKEKPKRKYTKVTERIVSGVTVSLRLSRRYGDPAALVARLESLPLEAPFRLRQIAARGRSVRASFTTPVATSVRGQRHGFEALASGDTLLQALRWLYGGIAAGRRAA
jgi:hypothetical protein